MRGSMISRFGTPVRWIVASGVVLLLVLVGGVFVAPTSSYARLDPVPQAFDRLEGELTINLSGKRSALVSTVSYRLEGEPEWQQIDKDSPRSAGRELVFELDPDTLSPGAHTLEVRVQTRFGTARYLSQDFDVEAAPEVPARTTITWDPSDLEAQDGAWDVAPTPAGQTGTWVRPKPGREGYDRILLATPPFVGARRVTTQFVFDERVGSNPRHGVGVLPLWGGHPDSEQVRPRRGWLYGLAWWYSEYPGFGAEFAHKIGGGDIASDTTSNSEALLAGVVYTMITEAVPVIQPDGSEVFELRMKWATSEDGEPLDAMDWILVTRDPEGDVPVGSSYAVAVLAHRAKARFGPVTVERLN